MIYNTQKPKDKKEFHKGDVIKISQIVRLSEGMQRCSWLVLRSTDKNYVTRNSHE